MRPPPHPHAGDAAAPTGVVPHRQGPSHDMPAAKAPPAGRPHAPSIAGGRDAKGFLDYVKKEGKPGLVSFVGNAFQARMDHGALTVFFDESHANLIPMIKSAGHQGQLAELGAAYFNQRPQIHFAVGKDPKVVARNAEEEKAMEIVNDHPAIKFLLDTFNGRIVNCQVMGDDKE